MDENALIQKVEEMRQQQMMMGYEPIPEYAGGDPMEYLTNLSFMGTTGAPPGVNYADVARNWAEQSGIPGEDFNAHIEQVNADSAARRRGGGLLGNVFTGIGELTRVGRGEATGIGDLFRDTAGLAAVGYGTSFLPGAGAAPAGAAPAAGAGTLAPVSTTAAALPGGALSGSTFLGATTAATPLAAMPAIGAGGAVAGGAGGLVGSVAGAAPAALQPSAPPGAMTPPAATPPIAPPGTVGNVAAGGNWWQNILGGLGIDPSQGFSAGNIFGGLQGLAGLSAMTGGNDLSDLFGLTGADAGAFRAVNTATPGGGGTNYNPDTNTLTGTGGNLDPVQAQLAAAAGTNIAQSGQNTQGNILELLRQQAAPQEAKAFQGINQNLFSRGRLGAQDSATGEAYEGFARGQSLADLSRQVAAYGLSDQLQTSALGRGLGAMSGSSQLQTRALGPYSPIGNDTRGQASPMFDFFNQFFQPRG